MDDTTATVAARGGTESVRFEATVLTVKPNGKTKERRAWLRFSTETVAEAGGRTRTVRFAQAETDSGDRRANKEWSRGIIAEIPDLDAAEASVIAWLRGDGRGSAHLRLGQATSSEGGLAVVHAAGRSTAASGTCDPGDCSYQILPASDPMCAGTSLSGCGVTICPACGGGSDWPPPDPDWDDPNLPSLPPTGPGGGGGSGPGYNPGGGPGDNECDPTALQQSAGCDEAGNAGDPVSADEVREYYEDCNNPDSQQGPDDLFEHNVIEMLGAISDTREGTGYRTLDGYKTRNGYIINIYEVKSVGSHYAFGSDYSDSNRRSINQTLAHIDRLAEHREALWNSAGRPVHLDIGAPTYTVITTSPRAPKLDANDEILAHARLRGVNLEVYQLQKRFYVDWYLTGYRLNAVAGRIGDWYANISYGAAPDWAQWFLQGGILPEEGFRATCDPLPVQDKAPDPPAHRRPHPCRNS